MSPKESGLILPPRWKGWMAGGGCEPRAGACRGRGHLHPPNSDILQEWLEALKPTSSLFLREQSGSGTCES